MVTKTKPRTSAQKTPVLTKKQEGARKTVATLARYYPDAHCALHFTNPFELLVATILSAQCTDDRVNIVTPALFAKYGTPVKMAKAPVEDVEKLIHSTGFYKNKAKNLVACAQALVRDHKGEVPRSLDELTALAGVGRKTANVVLGNAFGIPSGVVVDTHVSRLANRFGWVKTENAVVIERALAKLIPEENWIMLSHWLIAHGRAVCKARKPHCEKCFLESECPQRLT